MDTFSKRMQKDYDGQEGMGYDQMLERLGRLVDSLENGIAFSKLPSLDYPLMRDGLLHFITEARNEVKSIYLEAGGDDVWTLGDYR